MRLGAVVNRSGGRWEGGMGCVCDWIWDDGGR